MVHIPGTSSNTNNSGTNAQNTSSSSTMNTSNTTSNTSGSSNPLSETKAKISSFLGRDGQADTTVHETINPAVEHEHISRAQREERQKIIDREIHQEHHHTTVQPIVDKEVAPTTHTNRVEGVETREIQHGNDARVRQELEQERAQFRNTQDVAPTVVTEQQGPTIAGEHIHHHVHENIQPVIEKDIHQEHVIHTTKPVHEIHQNESIHHTASTLPPVDVSTFKQQGGHLSGRQERVDAFQGPPKPIENATNHTIGGPGAHGTTTVTGNDGRGSSNINQSSMGSTHMSGSNHGTAGTAMTGNHMSTSSSASDFDNKAGISRNGGTTDSSRSGLGHTNAAAGGTGLGAGSAGTGSSTTAQGMTGTSGVGGASTGMAGGATHGTTGMKNAQGERGGLGNNVMNNGSGHNSTSSTGHNATGKKGSLIDKLNPTKDSTGHGDPGFMH